ncbi:hypothetical protein FSP39_009522 [Pinctada imbricata]|uniref:Fork-head domain-containing protein n=1 Tax=Pinctada imbricata TaxID=66713 RepID=A0AA88Y8D8_PINIB|nr:hypothetical protein FSP39_009522 [Pinctada imbricata]
MCSSNPGGVVLPFGLKVPNPSPYVQFPGGIPHMALDLHRAQQICDYSSRLQYGVRGFPTQMGFAPYHPSSSADPYLHHYFYKDPRVRYVHEEPKPNHSYIGLIAMAILSSRDKKLVLSDIYQWILDNYPYFRTRGPGWRNSIRHNLSLNDCFIKSGRSANGKGHYWAIHPANIDDFQKGDFRRRRAQRRVRKHMGLSVPDDDDSPSPSPTSSTRPSWDEDENIEVDDKADDQIDDEAQSSSHSPSSESGSDGSHHHPAQTVTKKRLFDMESLLAPDDRLAEKRLRDSHHVYNEIHVRRVSSADINDTSNLLRHCSSAEIGSTDNFRSDEKALMTVMQRVNLKKSKRKPTRLCCKVKNRYQFLKLHRSYGSKVLNNLECL